MKSEIWRPQRRRQNKGASTRLGAYYSLFIYPSSNEQGPCVVGEIWQGVARPTAVASTMVKAATMELAAKPLLNWAEWWLNEYLAGITEARDAARELAAKETEDTEQK